MLRRVLMGLLLVLILCAGGLLGYGALRGAPPAADEFTRRLPAIRARMQQLPQVHIQITRHESHGSPPDSDSQSELYFDFPQHRSYTVYTITGQLSTQHTESIQIGADQYTRTATGAWDRGPADDRAFALPDYLVDVGLLPNPDGHQTYVQTRTTQVNGTACDIYAEQPVAPTPSFEPSGTTRWYCVGRQSDMIYQAEITSVALWNMQRTRITLQEEEWPPTLTAPDLAQVRPTTTPVPTEVLTATLPGWTLTAERDSRPTRLAGILALASDAVWAVGDSEPTTGGHALIERWDGRHWQQIPNPAPGGSSLAAVSGREAGDIWAVGVFFGSNGKRQTLIEHWDGTTWAITPSPNVPGADNELYGVAALGPHDVWAVGDSFFPRRALILHWDGRQWQQVPLPGPAPPVETLYAVSGTGPTDVWAVGGAEQGDQLPVLAHWDGTQWQRQASLGTGCQLQAVASQGGEAWAVGNCSGGGVHPRLVAHWDGQQWQIDPGAAESGEYTALTGVTMRAPDDVWVVGYSGATSVVEHWDGHRWARVPSPDLTDPTGSYMQTRFLGVTTSADGSVWVAGVADPRTSRLLGRYTSR